MIGGDGVEIEIDETVLVHRKYQRSRIIKTVWLFSGLERLTKRAFMVPLLTECGEGNRRDVDTFIPIIRRYIRPRSIIYSDCWCAYSNLSSMGYTHNQVNQSEHFVDPHNPAIHTQNIKRLWGSLKSALFVPE
uniref:ISXO2-like transposase domain-containing protein n=1 Tax=Octopus bimaculoides TaxID=37653 RepID=A0A0L8GID3_OCTBM